MRIFQATADAMSNDVARWQPVSNVTGEASGLEMLAMLEEAGEVLSHIGAELAKLGGKCDGIWQTSGCADMLQQMGAMQNQTGQAITDMATSVRSSFAEELERIQRGAPQDAWAPRNNEQT